MNFIDIGKRTEIYADGVHDDTSAIQRCLDELKNGGRIYFPDGTYLISSCLIFYSNQHLDFSDNAVLLRSDKSEIITKYMLASYSEPDVGGYNGTHDVTITGGIFDGNKNLTEKLTILNTVHCKNITVKNVKFVHGALWHYIEFNSTESALVSKCVFDGMSYTVKREDLTSELIQVDAAIVGAYGPVYDCSGKEIEFLPDKIPCRLVEIDSCVFECGGFSAIGHHGNDEHIDIVISNNVFKGPSGNAEASRGYISFMELSHGIKIENNVFDTQGSDMKCVGILTKSNRMNAVEAANNVFEGNFEEYFIGNVVEENNIKR